MTLSLKIFVADPDPGADAHNGGVVAQMRSGGSVEQWSQICITLMRSRIRLRIHSEV